MKVNGRAVDDDVEPTVVLVDYLRSELGLTGAKVGCETGQCGACAVSVDGRAVKGCLALVVQLDGGIVETVEGLAPDGALTPLQQALHDEHGTQCGFCTPGVVMAMTDLLATDPDPGEAEIRAGLSGNLCRCTGYQSIVRAVLAAASQGTADAPAEEAASDA